MARSATDFFLVPEIADRLKVDPQQVRLWIAEGKLTALVVPPDVIRVSPIHLRRFIRAFSHPWSGWGPSRPSIGEDWRPADPGAERPDEQMPGPGGAAVPEASGDF